MRRVRTRDFTESFNSLTPQDLYNIVTDKYRQTFSVLYVSLEAMNGPIGKKKGNIIK